MIGQTHRQTEITTLYIYIGWKVQNLLIKRIGEVGGRREEEGPQSGGVLLIKPLIILRRI